MATNYPYPVMGWDAVKLSAYSLEQLQELREAVTNDPKNANPDHATGKSIYLYTKAARDRLDALGWAITYKLKEMRA
jgi:hypothetical protein